MRFEEFKKSVSLPVFTALQADQPAIQLSRWSKTGKLIRIKRGIYQFADRQADEFSLAGYLYQPSYISLEAALNNFGIIPDVSANVTSVSPITTKIIKTAKGTFIYSKISRPLYFGWQKIKDGAGLYYQIALPEKALLDWIYLRKVNNLHDQRVDLSGLNRARLKQFSRYYPRWVKGVINEQFNR
jgi:hypothetical protein